MRLLFVFSWIFIIFQRISNVYFPNWLKSCVTNLSQSKYMMVKPLFTAREIMYRIISVYRCRQINIPARKRTQTYTYICTHTRKSWTHQNKWPSSVSFYRALSSSILSQLISLPTDDRRYSLLILLPLCDHAQYEAGFCRREVIFPVSPVGEMFISW